MPVTEILKKIDAYLLTLRQARELLLAPATEARRRSSPLPKRLRSIEATATATPSRSRAKKAKIAQTAPVRKAPNKRVRANSVSRATNSVTHAEPVQNKPQIEPPKPAPKETLPPPQVAKAEVPAPDPRRAVRVIRPARRRAPRPALHTKVEVEKPAIALAGSMNSKIVVVSAEEARRERDRSTAQPEVRRPRLPSSGLSGRLAFEALFNDVKDSAKNS